MPQYFVILKEISRSIFQKMFNVSISLGELSCRTHAKYQFLRDYRLIKYAFSGCTHIIEMREILLITTSPLWRCIVHVVNEYSKRKTKYLLRLILTIRSEKLKFVEKFSVWNKEKIKISLSLFFLTSSFQSGLKRL